MSSCMQISIVVRRGNRVTTASLRNKADQSEQDSFICLKAAHVEAQDLKSGEKQTRMRKSRTSQKALKLASIATNCS